MSCLLLNSDIARVEQSNGGMQDSESMHRVSGMTALARYDTTARVRLYLY